MAGSVADFVKETTSTTGTGTLTLVAVTGFAEAIDAFARGTLIEYTIRNGDNWETGEGTLGAAKTLARTTPKVTLVAGTYDDTTPTAITLVGDSTVFIGASANLLNTKLETITSDPEHFTGLGTAASPLDHSVVMHDMLDFFVGATLDNVQGTITESGGVITATVEKLGTGDVRYKIAGEVATLDCTPLASVVLTAGSDISPQYNYMYIDTTTNLMANSVSGWPSGVSYVPLAISLIGSSGLVSTDGSYMTQQWNDHVREDSNNGHLSHINERIRRLPADYVSGLALSNSGTPSATVTLAITAGELYQLHNQICPAITTPAPFYIINDETTAYSKHTNLADITTDSVGDSVNNKYMSLVVFYTYSALTGDSKLYINKPSGSYSSESDARADGFKYTDFSIPTMFKNTAVLISRLVCRNSGGTLTIYSGAGDDLRGTTPGTAGGSSTSVGTEFVDSVFRVQNVSDITKEVAFDATRITTGNTRTITMPDADVDLADIATNNAKVTNVSTNLSIGTRDTNTTDINSSDGTNVTIPAATTSLSGLLTGADKTKLDGLGSILGKQTIYNPATAMTAQTTAPAASGSVETTTNKVMIETMDFDTAADEFVQFSVRMPKSWDAGTVTAAFTWSHAATTTNFGVAWGIQGVALVDGDAADTAFGTAIVTTDTGGTTDDIYISADSTAITIANTPAKSDWVVFQVFRDVSDAGDTMAIDARLHGVSLFYTTDEATDA